MQNQVFNSAGLDMRELYSIYLDSCHENSISPVGFLEFQGIIDPAEQISRVARQLGLTEYTGIVELPTIYLLSVMMDNRHPEQIEAMLREAGLEVVSGGTYLAYIDHIGHVQVYEAGIRKG